MERRTGDKSRKREEGEEREFYNANYVQPIRPWGYKK
jgi:hypothetical protein